AGARPRSQARITAPWVRATWDRKASRSPLARRASDRSRNCRDRERRTSASLAKGLLAGRLSVSMTGLRGWTDPRRGEKSTPKLCKWGAGRGENGGDGERPQ